MSLRRASQIAAAKKQGGRRRPSAPKGRLTTMPVGGGGRLTTMPVAPVSGEGMARSITKDKKKRGFSANSRDGYKY